MSAQICDVCLMGPIRLKLPYDILLEMLNHIGDRSTLSRYMRTCRIMHRSGIAPLLRFRVNLHNHNIVSFCLFMLADLTRCANVRQLSLLIDNLGQIWVGDVLPAIIQHAKHLEELTVTTFLFEMCPNLGSAVAATESVTKLGVNGGPNFDDLPRWMPVIRSPIRELIVHHTAQGKSPKWEDDEREDDERVELVSVASAVSETLEVLRVCHADWCDSDALVTFPLLHTLDLIFPKSDETATLFKIAPNLKHLLVDGDDAICFIETDEDRRAHNIAEQEEHGTWPSLDRVEMLRRDLYPMAPHCHIRELYIREVFANPDPYRLVIEAAQPEYLKIDVFIDEMSQFPYLLPLFQATPLSVTRFQIELTVPEELPAGEFMDLFVRSMEHHRTLTHLALCVMWVTPGKPLTLPLEAELANGDAENRKLAERLANMLPRIHYICFDLSSNNECRSSHRYWEVMRCQDDVQLTLMDERTMKRIRSQIWMFKNLE